MKSKKFFIQLISISALIAIFYLGEKYKPSKKIKKNIHSKNIERIKEKLTSDSIKAEANLAETKKRNDLDQIRKNKNLCRDGSAFGCYEVAKVNLKYKLDFEEAKKYMIKACDLDYSYACLEFANNFLTSKTGKDALSFYRKGCKQNITKACLFLARFGPLQEDFTQALTKLKNKCEDNSFNCLYVGDAYKHAKKIKKAKSFYKMGCEGQGTKSQDRNACNALELMSAN